MRLIVLRSSLRWRCLGVVLVSDLLLTDCQLKTETTLGYNEQTYSAMYTGLKYVCKPIELTIENRHTCFTSAYGNQSTVWMTQGNGDGNFFADADTLKAIEDNDQVVFRYADNPNGSVNDIAGIMNKAGNVLGMMPHPDRAFEPALGSADGAPMFKSLVGALQGA